MPAATPGPRSSNQGALRPSPGLILGIILIAQMMVVLDATIVNVALPDIARGLAFSTTSLSWVVTAYTLAFGGLLLIGARAGDLMGRRRIFTAGIAIFTAASLACGLAPSAGWLIAARVVQGAGGALAVPSALALLMTAFAEGPERTRAIGWYSAVSIGGSAVGLILGGMLTQWASWRWVFFVNVPVGIALLVAARRNLAETAVRNGRHDIAGGVVSTLGVTALVYGFVSAASSGWGDATTVASFVAGIALLAAFVVIETRAAEPITPLHLFMDRTRSASYLGRLFLIAGMFGMFFFLTQFLQNILGYTPLQTGMAFVPLTVLLFVMTQLSARQLIRRVGPKPLLVGGLSISTIALLMLTQLSASSGYIAVLIPLVLFGTGNGLAFVPLTSASLSGVAREDAGAASGLVNVMQQLGGAVGLGVLISVYGDAGRRVVQGGASVAYVTAAHRAFVAGADRAFLAAAMFVGATVLLLAVAVPGRRALARQEAMESDAAVEAIAA